MLLSALGAAIVYLLVGYWPVAAAAEGETVVAAAAAVDCFVAVAANKFHLKYVNFSP